MDNTYYTPSIDEFHVGFEYEQKPFNKEWEEYTRQFTYPEGIHNYTKIHGTEALEKPLEKECVRVKYLDGKDVRELGFEKSDDNIFYSKNNIEINLREDEGFRYPIDIMVSGKTYSMLTIKNKSELKRILSQIYNAKQ